MGRCSREYARTQATSLRLHEVWASEASDGDELYSVTQYLLIVLVKTPDTKNKAGETYWECVGEINSFKWADCLKESHL